MLLIFDWDGTLCDSTGIIVQAMRQAAVELGWQEPSVDSVRNIIGLGLPEALQALFPDASTADKAAVRDGYRKYYLQADKDSPAELYPHVLDTLEQLRLSGHQLAVATGKSRQGLDRVLSNLDLAGFFHGSRCADETASKPNPLMLHQLLKEFGSGPADAVMVGDTEYDLDMGQRAGMDTIAVSYGAHAPERLSAYSPAMCMDCFSQLLSWERLALR